MHYLHVHSDQQVSFLGSFFTHHIQMTSYGFTFVFNSLQLGKYLICFVCYLVFLLLYMYMYLLRRPLRKQQLPSMGSRGHACQLQLVDFKPIGLFLFFSKFVGCCHNQRLIDKILRGKIKVVVIVTARTAIFSWVLNFRRRVALKSTMTVRGFKLQVKGYRECFYSTPKCFLTSWLASAKCLQRHHLGIILFWTPAEKRKLSNHNQMILVNTRYV